MSPQSCLGVNLPDILWLLLGITSSGTILAVVERLLWEFTATIPFQYFKNEISRAIQK
jgi:hypothetical protein